MRRAAGDRLTLHVSRVADVAEAEALLAAGADYVGFQCDDLALFDLAPNPLWSDGRMVYAADIPDLMGHLPSGRCVIDLPRERIAAEDLAAIVSGGGTCIQISDFQTPDDTALAAIEAAGLGIIYSGRYLSPGDGPLLPALKASPLPLCAALELQVFPSEGDAFALLLGASTDPSGEIVTLAEIDALATALPLILSLNVTPQNAREIVECLHDTAVLGLGITLSDAEHGAFHTTRPEAAADVLRALAAHR